MSVDNFIPEVWSQELNTQLRRNRVMTALVNRNWEGEIEDEGDTVRIQRPDSVSTKDYSGSVTYDSVTSSQQVLSIDQSTYFAFAVDDVDQVQANQDLVEVYTEEAGQSMATDDDEFIAGLYTGAGQVINKATIDSSNIWAKMVEAGKRLDENDVPQQGRVAVLSPYMLAAAKESSQFLRASDLGDEVVMEGSIGRINGFNVFMSNSVQVVNDGTDDVEHNLLGTSAAITWAEQLLDVEALRLEDQFGDGVRGLHVYGAKVVRSEALVDLRRTV